MITTRPLTAFAVTAATLGLSLGAAATSQAAAKKPAKPAATKKATTVTACVKNKTGATTVLLGSKAKKKCPKGSTKVTWNVAGKNGTNGRNGTNGTNGANGATGAAGATGPKGSDAPALAVRDAKGTVLGAFAGVPFSGLGLSLTFISVLRDGGIYSYLPTGQLTPSLLSLGGAPDPSAPPSIAGTPIFLDATCIGQAYLQVPVPVGPVFDFFVGMLGDPTRFVFRTFAPASDPGAPAITFGAARVWKATTSHRAIPDSDGYYLDPATGNCEELPAQVSGEILALQSIPAPPDGVGPLSVS